MFLLCFEKRNKLKISKSQLINAYFLSVGIQISFFLAVLIYLCIVTPTITNDLQVTKEVSRNPHSCTRKTTYLPKYSRQVNELFKIHMITTTTC